MRLFKPLCARRGLTATALSLCLATALYWFTMPFVMAQNDGPAVNPGPETAEPETPDAAPQNSAPATNAAVYGPPAPKSLRHKPGTPAAMGTPNEESSTNAPDGKEKKDKKKSPDDLIQLSFQGANIDMIVRWLAETTGKSVVKHPQVQCQITIVGSKKITRQEAITLVYHALGLEGFIAIESSKSIMIMPEGKEPKLSPELIDAGQAAVPGGKERLIKVFNLQHTQAALIRDKVRNLLTEKGTIDVDEQANALIITDYNDNVATAGKLIATLDTDKPQDLMVRVIAIKNANASELAKELEPFYPSQSGGGGGGGRRGGGDSGMGMMGMNMGGEGRPSGGSGGGSSKGTLQISANERSNSLLVYSSEADFKSIQQLVATLDTEDAQEKVMHSFVLQNADAEDVAKQLQDLYKASDNNNNSYPYFYWRNQSDNSPKPLNVVADRRRNAIIVQASPTRMEGIIKMVTSLDEPLNGDNLAPKIYVLKYVSAADIEDVLNDLFLKHTQQRSYWWDDQPQESVDRDVGRLYGKVRITSEPYSNAIIVTSNSAESLAAVEQVLKELDVPSEAGETTFRIGLRFADAAVMANSINVLFAKGGSPAMHQQPQNNPQQNNQPQNNQQQNQPNSTSTESTFEISEQVKEESYFPWLGGQPDTQRSANDTRAQRPVSDLIGRVRVVPDPRSNSLLISANVHFFPQVLKLIQDMDVPTAEVMIEARIVEVSSDFLDQLGVRWSPNGTASFTGNDQDNGIVASSTGSYQTGFGGKSVVGSALSSIRTGLVNNTISMDFLIQFLHEHTDAIVLADPLLEIGDNEHGRLFVGERVPVPTGTVNPSVGGSSTSITYQDAGVTLEVEPHINDSGDVTLRILTESSTVSPTQGLDSAPIFNTANFHTELIATNGQTLILGGIIQKQSTLTIRKTPFFGSIPIVKWAFNKKDNSDQRTELLVFLRPRVTRTPEEARKLLDEVNRKTPLIQNWEQTEAAKKDLTPQSQPAPKP